MAKLVFDIETIGEDFDKMDEVTQESLTWWIKKESQTEDEYRVSLGEIKDGLGFSALTGEIVALGVLDCDQNKGAVYFQSPKKEIKEWTEGNFKFEPMTEKKILDKFWQIAEKYDEFISFNGRQFDVPFIMIRSAVQEIKVRKNLMDGRYLYQQKSGSRHIDLLDQLTFYGATKRRGGLHLWSRLFGIKSPKTNGISGDDVGRLFKEKKYEDIARYNVSDLVATKELYERWSNFIKI